MVFGRSWKQQRVDKANWIKEWDGKVVTAFALFPTPLEDGRWVWLSYYKVEYWWGEVTETMRKRRYV